MAALLIEKDFIRERQKLEKGQNVPSIRPEHQEDQPDQD
jgi:hypothetical protein